MSELEGLSDAGGEDSGSDGSGRSKGTARSAKSKRSSRKSTGAADKCKEGKKKPKAMVKVIDPNHI
jgi:hypothetical protein